MSIQANTGVFSVVQLAKEGAEPKADISLSNGVKIYSVSGATIADSKCSLPNNSLYIDANGAFGVIQGGKFKPFACA